jgi:hypothetical protein
MMSMAMSYALPLALVLQMTLRFSRKVTILA